ncbi:MAG: FCD domain-containing protein, partial [Pseudomonadota bacterium]
AFYRTDVDFHRVLYDVTGNPLLSSLHKAYTEWLSPHWSKMPRIQARNQKNYEAHAAVFHWILRRDPDQAERALRSHLEDAWTQVSQTFRGL